MKKEKYQIRFAAGSYWLLDMEQNGFDYKSPQAFNETGMYIFTRLYNGKTIMQIAEDMFNDFGVSVVDARKDIEHFIEIMDKKGILREG